MPSRGSAPGRSKSTARTIRDAASRLIKLTGMKPGSPAAEKSGAQLEHLLLRLGAPRTATLLNDALSSADSDLALGKLDAKFAKLRESIALLAVQSLRLGRSAP